MLAIADIDAEAAEALARELGEGHVALATDLSDGRQAAALCSRASSLLGGLDIVVNNAGITDTSGETIAGMDAERIRRLVAVNLSSVETICRAAGGHLGPGGAIVNIASGAAFRPIALRGAYSASKAGVVALTGALAGERAAGGPRIAAIAPGFVRTALVERLISQGRLDVDTVVARIPLGRMIAPEEIADAVAFAVSPDGAALDGLCLGVDGGSLAAAGAGLPPGDNPEDVRPAATALVVGNGALALRVAGKLGENVSVTRQDAARCDGSGPFGTIVVVWDAAARPVTDLLEEAGRIASMAVKSGTACASVQFHAVTGDAANAGTRAAAAALGMFARTLALELAPRGVRVNGVTSHESETDAVAGLAVFLAGEGARSVTATHLETRAAA